jgi:hypothetical protein
VKREIVRLLNRHGIETWYSTDDIGTGAEWETRIREGLKSCDWFLVVLSSQSVKSQWVQAEVHWAMDERKGRIVPVLTDDCDPADLHLMLRQIQFVDFRKDVSEGQRKLVSVWSAAETPRIMNLWSPDYVRSRHELRLVEGPPESKANVYHITGKHLIGRYTEVPSRYADHSMISVFDCATARAHAVIVLDEDGCVHLRDLGSSNGSFVNGKSVDEAQLHDGDLIAVSRTVFQYRTFTEDQIQRDD